jgi:septal ring factor EnvC (AmiA/AmiB activator)
MNFITDNWQAITGLLGSVIAFFGGRKLKQTEHKNKEANALQSMQETYDKWTADTNKQIDVLMSELTDVKKENIAQREDLRLLHKDNRSLHNQLTALSKENNELRSQLAELKRHNESLIKRLKKYEK